VRKDNMIANCCYTAEEKQWEDKKKIQREAKDYLNGRREAAGPIVPLSSYYGAEDRLGINPHAAQRGNIYTGSHCSMSLSSERSRSVGESGKVSGGRGQTSGVSCPVDALPVPVM
jgi:hypothetical protein